MKTRALVMALCCIPALSWGKGRPSRGNTGPARQPSALPGQGGGLGRITDITAEAVFVDRGASDGVTVGQWLDVLRGNKKVGSCQVEGLSAHRARCTGQALQVGDRVAVARVAAPVLAPLAPLPDARALAPLGRMVEGAGFAPIDFAQGLSAGPGGPGVRIALSHFSAIDPSAGRTAYHLERLDARLAELQLGHGLSIAADGSLLLWSSRPADTRDLRASNVQLLLRQLQLTWRPDSLPIIASVGRLAPRHTPGLMALDGAQLGWHNATNTVEVGVYGGLLPSAITLYPSTAWAAGGYGAFHSLAQQGDSHTLLQLDARAGWSVRPGLGSRLEAGVSGSAFIGRTFDATAQVLMGALAQGAPVALDSATLTLSARPTDRLALTAFGRYRGNPQLEFASVGAPLPATRSVHASGSAAFEVTSLFTVSAQGGVGNEIATGLGQYWVGPEVALPRLLDGHLGLSAGYQEEFGTWRGRSGTLGAQALLGQRVRLTARASYFQQLNLGIDGIHELGLSATADAALLSWLSLRINVLTRLPLTSTSGTPGTGQGAVQLVAQF